MRAEVLTADAALRALGPEWEALWRRAGDRATPFQSPAWLLPWWRAFGTGRPRAATLRGGDGRLLGLLLGGPPRCGALAVLVVHRALLLVVVALTGCARTRSAYWVVLLICGCLSHVCHMQPA